MYLAPFNAVVRRALFTATALTVLAVSSAPAAIIYVSFRDLGKIEKYDLASGADLGALATGLNSPQGLALDAANNLYASNVNNSSILKITPDGTVTTFASGSGLDGPQGLVFDPAGNLYAANSNTSTISRISPLGIVSTFANSGLSSPAGLALDLAGNLYAANIGDNSITKILPNGSTSVFAANGGLSFPFGIAFDDLQNLYVANLGSSSISKITPSGTISTFASGSQLQAPLGLVYNGSGTLLTAGRAVTQVAANGTVTPFASTNGDQTYSIVISQVPEPGVTPLLVLAAGLFRGFRRPRSVAL